MPRGARSVRAVRRTRDRVVELEPDPIDDQSAVFFRDPDGTRLEPIERLFAVRRREEEDPAPLIASNALALQWRDRFASC